MLRYPTSPIQKRKYKRQIQEEKYLKEIPFSRNKYFTISYYTADWWCPG